MDTSIGPLERAFQLARTGKYRNVGAIKDQLRREGYSADQLVGRTLGQQLLAIIRVTKKSASHADLIERQQRL